MIKFTDDELLAIVQLIRRWRELRMAVGHNEARAEVDRLRAAIVKHSQQKADDWMDDMELYSVVPTIEMADFQVGDKAAMLKNCERFVNNRCLAGGPWKSYAELEAEIKKLRAALAGLIPWAGDPPDGPSWATPEAKAKNRAMFEEAFKAASECFPDNAIINPDGTSESLLAPQPDKVR